MTNRSVNSAATSEKRCSQTFPIGIRIQVGGGRPPKQPALWWLALQREILSLAFLGANSNRLFLLAILLVPHFDGVGPRRKTLDGIGAVGTGDGEERVADHADVGAHPGVD